MKFLLIHNDYGAPSGEEVTFEHIGRMLAAEGHEVAFVRRRSGDIGGKLAGRARAFFSGIYSRAAVREVRDRVAKLRPDIAFVQNLYPLISPAVLPELRRQGIPIVMRVANYRLLCPNGLFLSHGEPCRRCPGAGEFWCVLRNCEGSLPKSLGYALRNAVARRMRWYADNVGAYLSATRFLRDCLAQGGFDRSRIHVVPNIVPEPEATAPAAGEERYVGYAGRLSREKGIEDLLRAATLCPDIPFRIAGAAGSGYTLSAAVPPNVTLVGHLERADLGVFYAGARIMVTPSRCYETFGMSVAEAMLHGRPVVVPDHGVFPELVRDGETGVLFPHGDAAALAACLRSLWDEPARCAAIGAAARGEALLRYSPQAYYAGFMRACAAAQEQGAPVATRGRAAAA